MFKGQCYTTCGRGKQGLGCSRGSAIRPVVGGSRGWVIKGQCYTTCGRGK